MKIRIGLITGFAIGYYLGAMAGRERYDQLNRIIGKIRRSNAMDNATDKAKHVVDLSYERAKDGVQHKIHHNGRTQPQGVPS